MTLAASVPVAASATVAINVSVVATVSVAVAVSAITPFNTGVASVVSEAVALSATAELKTKFASVVSEPVAVSATAEFIVRFASVVSEPVAVSATSFWYVLPPDTLIAENGAVENGSKPNTLLPYMSCAVVRLETWDVVKTSGIVMGIASEGDVCQALSTQALSAWFQFH